jgi:hypothetical protein
MAPISPDGDMRMHDEQQTSLKSFVFPSIEAVSVKFPQCIHEAISHKNDSHYQ